MYDGRVNTSGRPLRADAERNRRAILCAAASLFAEEGTDVTLERIASIAGVGVGTIYRRFSSVEEVVAIVLEGKMSAYADRTEQAAEQALKQPWVAFRDYVLFILEQQADDIAFSQVALSPGRGTELFRRHTRRALVASHRLVERVREAGAIRPDFDHSDLYLLLNANAGLVRSTRTSSPEAWKRLGHYMLQAFRHRSESEPLPPPSEVWLRAQQPPARERSE
jgi:AcrR family transcriptional regulator